MPKVTGGKRMCWAERLRENIQYIMLKRHKTLREVADYMGVAEKTLKAKLDDPQRFGADELMTLAMLFGCEPALFWCGSFKVEMPEVPAGL